MKWCRQQGGVRPMGVHSHGDVGAAPAQPLHVADHGSTAEEGIGIHWVRHVKSDASRDSKRDEDLLFGPRTLGHGSFSGCIFLVDPDQQLVITQVRKRSGPRSAEWSPRFFQTVAAVLRE